MSGTVNISRGIWSDAAFKAEPFTEREAFMWMIMEASYKPREKRVGSAVIQTERGQLATSVRFMSEAWGWSKSRVDRFLKRLENRDMIGTDSGTGINLINVCKYDEYQGGGASSGTAKSENRDSSGTPAGQQRDKPKKGLIPDATQEQRETGKPASRASTAAFDAADFEGFWAAYPHRNNRKVNRQGAERAFAKAIHSGATVEQIAIGVEAMKRDRDVIRGFARDPTTWLNQRGWTDEIPESTGENNHDQRHFDRQQPHRANGPAHRPDPALANILRIAGLGQAPGGGCH